MSIPYHHANVIEDICARHSEASPFLCAWLCHNALTSTRYQHDFIIREAGAAGLRYFPIEDADLPLLCWRALISPLLKVREDSPAYEKVLAETCRDTIEDLLDVSF